MNFIKTLWTRVKTFFTGLFTHTPVKVVAAPAESVTVHYENIAAEASTPVVDTPAFDAAKEEQILAFNRIVDLAQTRSYTCDEAMLALEQGNLQTLVRIEREMKARKYKSPSKSKLKNLRRMTPAFA